MARILIVEDDAAIAKLLRIRLELNGHTLMVVADGERALPSIHDWAPDLILLDIMLPGLDGFQIARRLRLDITTQHLPIVMLTARADGQSMMTGLGRGADAYLTKPIDFSDLLRHIETCLRQSVQPALRPAHGG
jgi:two-component system alkaline phosphatase synthesis response regulator PhoP